MCHVKVSIGRIFGGSECNRCHEPILYAKNQGFLADEKLVSFVRPGLVIKIDSAQIASDGTISTVFRTTDPMGVPLDREGILTPGVISTSFIAAHIPPNQTQYVAYTTRSASGAVVASTQQV